MPESRRRKVYKARKRPRVGHSNLAPNTPQTPLSRNLQIAVTILFGIIAIVAVVYFINRRNTPPPPPPTVYELTTDSGLKIHDEKVGDGPSPRMGQRVRVHYIGWLENGKEFNNSHTMGRGQPAEFTVGGVIPAWTEALQTMKVGGKRKIFVPSNLGYGPQGNPPDIPPNANLEFEIELLGIK